jgi:hypothetical protein
MTLSLEERINGFAAVATPEPAPKRRSRDRQPFTPEPVEATVWWWWTDEGRTACMENQFSTLPATPIRFRCLGTTSTKSPKRYRVDLAQALDRIPELNRRELKALGCSLAVSLSRKLGIEVAPLAVDVIDTDLDSL